MNSARFITTLERRGVTLDTETLARVTNGRVERLLTVGNPKTAKGEKLGYLTAILHLAPSVGSGFNVCPNATEGCASACLNTAGRGSFDPTIHDARRRRTYWFFARREEFMAQLAREIRAHVKRARAHGLEPCVRLNGTSDIRWETVPVGDAPNIMGLFPSVRFYDYTKLTNRSGLPANYSLTLSAHEGTSDALISDALQQGTNVAVVFRSRAIMDQSTGVRSAGIRMRAMTLPRTYQGAPVIDGDKSDLRFLDPRGVIVALRAKGDAVSDDSGFVRDVA